MIKNRQKFSSNRITVPGDKSLSHRFVLFSSLIQGKSECTGFLEAEDPLNTMNSFRSLGVEFTKIANGSYQVNSPGLSGLQSPSRPLDFGNAGTGIRLSCGFLAGMAGMNAELTGDASLCKRPMARIIDPLIEMGAQVFSDSDKGLAPLKVVGNKLQDHQYISKIASAQIKSCLMFAAMTSGVTLDYDEPELSRDHTENILRFLGGDIEHLSETHFIMRPPYNFTGTKFSIPGDISSAAFFIVLGLIADQDSVLIIENVGLNPSRIGILEVLKAMGGRIAILNKRTSCGEEAGDLEIRGSELKRIDIASALIPSIIDEIPILTIAGLFAEGGFEIRNAEELRAKESDRIESVVSNLRKLGVKVDEFPDGYSFNSPSSLNPDVKIETFMDHRIAMSFSILSKLLNLNLQFDETSWVETSFPGFFEILKKLDEG
ncbi:3-phosphoshikimate 1-carboxyvinyltransferase [Leptospira sp. GIMC2001]|uniref:3-phosphoshikimate 1-carboxyvinyltransferase n=1 Tax=Leptospira sp. GIMC2001 TaxID=1513297 RepID=UPI003FA52418